MPPGSRHRLDGLDGLAGEDWRDYDGRGDTIIVIVVGRRGDHVRGAYPVLVKDPGDLRPERIGRHPRLKQGGADWCQELRRVVEILEVEELKDTSRRSPTPPAMARGAAETPPTPGSPLPARITRRAPLRRGPFAMTIT